MSLLLNALKQAEKQKAQSGDGLTDAAAPASPVKADAGLVELAMLPEFDLADVVRDEPRKQQQTRTLSVAAPASSPLELADIEPAATGDEPATPANLPQPRDEVHHTASADRSQEHVPLVYTQPDINTTPAATAAPASAHPNVTPQSQNPLHPTGTDQRLAQTLIAANARKTRSKPGGLRFIMLISLSGLVVAAGWLYWQTQPTHDPYTAPIVETEVASTDEATATATVTASAPAQNADVPTDTPTASIDTLATTKTTSHPETPMVQGNSQVQPLFQPRPEAFQPEPRAAVTPLPRSETVGSPVAEVSNVIEIRRQRRVPDIAERLDDAYRAYQSRDDITATRLYREVVAAQPGNIDALLGLGAIAERQGNTAQARHWFERVLSLDGTQSFALNALARLTDANQPNANPSERESRLKHLIDQGLANAATHAELGNVHAASQRWRDAQSAYFAAVGLEPDNALYQYNLAVALDHLDKRDAALRYYRQALYLSEQQTPPFDRAALLLRIQQLAAQP